MTKQFYIARQIYEKKSKASGFLPTFLYSTPHFSACLALFQKSFASPPSLVSL